MLIGPWNLDPFLQRLRAAALLVKLFNLEFLKLHLESLKQLTFPCVEKLATRTTALQGAVVKQCFKLKWAGETNRSSFYSYSDFFTGSFATYSYAIYSWFVKSPMVMLLFTLHSLDDDDSSDIVLLCLHYTAGMLGC